MHESPTERVKEMEKLPHGYFDVVLDTKSNTSVSCWKANKVVTVVSRPFARVTRYNQAEHRKTEMDQPQMIHVYNKGMGRVDQFDQILI